MRKIVIFLLLVIAFVSCKEKKEDHTHTNVDGVIVDNLYFQADVKGTYPYYRKIYWILQDSMNIVLEKQSCFYNCGKPDSAKKYQIIWESLHDSSKEYYKLMYPNDKSVDAELVKTKNCNCP